MWSSLSRCCLTKLHCVYSMMFFCCRSCWSCLHSRACLIVDHWQMYLCCLAAASLSSKSCSFNCCCWFYPWVGLSYWPKARHFAHPMRQIKSSFLLATTTDSVDRLCRLISDSVAEITDSFWQLNCSLRTRLSSVICQRGVLKLLVLGGLQKYFNFSLASQISRSFRLKQAVWKDSCSSNYTLIYVCLSVFLFILFYYSNFN